MNYNVLMVGAPGCVKTSLINRFTTGDINTVNKLFHRVKLHLLVYGKRRKLYLNIVESNNIEADICHARYDATLLFFDIREPYGDVLSLISTLTGQDYECGHIVVCAAKTDVGPSGIDKIIQGLKADGTIYDYIHTSAKTCKGLTAPFLSLARLCCGSNTVLDPCFCSD